ncbi:MAG: hypothetical protein ACKVIH_04975 [Burkholderiales bacterium]|mgnify:CR=1 FL=1
MKVKEIWKIMLPVDAIFAALGMIDWIKSGGFIGAAFFTASVMVTLLLVWRVGKAKY